MFDVEQITADFRADADDYIALARIAKRVEYELEPIDDLLYRQGVRSQEEIRGYAMQVVKGLMARGLRPGDYLTANQTFDGFRFWPGSPDEQMKRIETEWTALGRNPDPLEICWFALAPDEGTV